MGVSNASHFSFKGFDGFFSPHPLKNFKQPQKLTKCNHCWRVILLGQRLAKCSSHNAKIKSKDVAGGLSKFNVLPIRNHGETLPRNFKNINKHSSV